MARGPETATQDCADGANRKGCCKQRGHIVIKVIVVPQEMRWRRTRLVAKTAASAFALLLGVAPLPEDLVIEPRLFACPQ
jgi:hypothetical protein